MLDPGLHETGGPPFVEAVAVPLAGLATAPVRTPVATLLSVGAVPDVVLPRGRVMPVLLVLTLKRRRVETAAVEPPVRGGGSVSRKSSGLEDRLCGPLGTFMNVGVCERGSGSALLESGGEDVAPWACESLDVGRRLVDLDRPYGGTGIPLTDALPSKLGRPARGVLATGVGEA